MTLEFSMGLIKKAIILICCWILFFQYLIGQKTLEATKISTAIHIDGVLDEEVWENVPVAEGFKTWTPTPGMDASDPTEVRLLYNNHSLYISARMAVTSRDSIMTELTQRDDIGNTDWFGMILDTYGNGNDGLEFIVGATGVQFDAKVTDTNGEDDAWDAVWFSAVTLHDHEWIVEMEIPYSAIRFSSEEEQSWRINFMRSIRRKQEKSSWNFIDPTQNGFMTQSGFVTGFRAIKAPIRLSFSPYFSVYAQNYKDVHAANPSSNAYSYNGGMDVKFGINDAFTLDMTLIPDFGQVRSDDVVLNLSPFEVRYDENRPFFTEGTELFNQDDLFYSRRVGGSPIGRFDIEEELSSTEEIIENPINSQLYNATKISGRNSNGLGIGFFNAISKETNALIRNNESGTTRNIITSPLTNYNVIVLDQNMANNSKLSFINTNVWRNGNLYHDANVSSLKFDFKNKAQSYGTRGRVTVSQMIYPAAENEMGYSYNVGVRKLSGNLFASLDYYEISPDYNPRDFGFLRVSNLRYLESQVVWRQYQPFGPFNRGNFWSFMRYTRLVDPNKFSEVHFNLGFWMQAKNFWEFNMWSNFEPVQYDYNEPRTFGRYYQQPRWGNIGFYIGTDSRKKFRLSGYIDYMKANEEGRGMINYLIEPRYRFSNKLSVSMEAEVTHSQNVKGYVTDHDEDIIFGNRDQSTYINSIYATYTFNHTMGIMFRLRHYWSKVNYDAYYTLDNIGLLRSSPYKDFHDFSFSAFNIDMEYRWRFAPGSDLFIVWKDNISGVRDEEFVDYTDLSYRDGVRNLRHLPQTNSISLRMIYYLDFNDVKRAL